MLGKLRLVLVADGRLGQGQSEESDPGPPHGQHQGPPVRHTEQGRESRGTVAPGGVGTPASQPQALPCCVTGREAETARPAASSSQSQLPAAQHVSSPGGLAGSHSARVRRPCAACPCNRDVSTRLKHRHRASVTAHTHSHPALGVRPASTGPISPQPLQHRGPEEAASATSAQGHTPWASSHTRPCTVSDHGLGTHDTPAFCKQSFQGSCTYALHTPGSSPQPRAQHTH